MRYLGRQAVAKGRWLERRRNPCLTWQVYQKAASRAGGTAKMR